MRAIMTGQVGMEKKAYVEGVAALAQEAGEPMLAFHVGDRTYAEAPDVRPGRILDLPLGRLHAIRRSVFKDIISESVGHRHVLVNTHGTFRWPHGPEGVAGSGGSDAAALPRAACVALGLVSMLIAPHVDRPPSCPPLAARFDSGVPHAAGTFDCGRHGSSL